MPGKLFLDPQRDGTHAYKPIIAHAYCEGYAANQRGEPNDAPPGLAGEAGENYQAGWDDAAAGTKAPSCSAQTLSAVEIIPDPYFLTWDGAANPDNFPVGWVLSGQTAGSFYTPQSPGYRLGASPGDDPRLTAATPAVIGVTYRVAWRCDVNPESWTNIAFGGITVEMRAEPCGFYEVNIVAANTDAAQIAKGASLTDQTIAWLSIREVIG